MCQQQTLLIILYHKDHFGIIQFRTSLGLDTCVKREIVKLWMWDEDIEEGKRAMWLWRGVEVGDGVSNVRTQRWGHGEE